MQFGSINFQNPTSHIVEKVAVMCDGQHGTFVLLEKALEPSHCVGVQMVRRLVQAENVWLGDEEAG